jgi:hypothetical protein
MIEDISLRAATFWATTIALIRVEARDPNAGPREGLKARESLEVHSLMRRGLLDGGLRHVLLSFTKD